jgi:thymidylate synthase ThyX
MPLDPSDRDRIARHVSSLTEDVFSLFGLPEEVIAVLFAYYSRSSGDLRTNLARLLAEDTDVPEPATPPRFASDKAQRFHERWVIGYGHASVAEHAVVHLALENVSIIASKVIEDLRLGSFTEKSTRYVVFSRHSFVEPPGLDGDDLLVYRASNERLFTTYLDLMPRVIQSIEQSFPRPEEMTEAGYAAAVRGQACDLLRGLLPAGTRTNLGLTANARAVETLLAKMYSHPLGEVTRIAGKMREAAVHVVPTLVKHAGKSDFRAGLRNAVAEALGAVCSPPDPVSEATMVLTQPVRLVRYDKDAVERVALALAYEGSSPPAHAAALMDGLGRATREELVEVIKAAFALRGPHDPAPRGLEASSMTVELMLDYGSYRDLQRHRFLSPATQRLTCQVGFDTPHELAALGFAEAYEDALLGACHAWQRLEGSHPLEAQYAVPLAYRIRTLWTLNLRELFHVVELRSSRQGHPSYRRIAQGLYRMATSVHPWLADLIRVDLNDYARARS